MSATFWNIIGFLGAAIFFSRFIVQWIESERQKKSVLTLSFWFWSFIGTVLLLAYSIWRQDIVFILAQGLSLVIYGRNIMLMKKNRERRMSTPPG